jgi:8-oxo-dGTP pyrophosphatase MutT (NUDIX family)
MTEIMKTDDIFIYLKQNELNNYINLITKSPYNNSNILSNHELMINEVTESGIKETEKNKLTESRVTENGVTESILTEKNEVTESGVINTYNYTEEEKKRYKNVYCVNCGIKGHVVKDCDAPITSFGIIAFKIVTDKESENFDKNDELNCILQNLNQTKNDYPKIKFLMIQRKDTMGYIDFIRGKYPEDNTEVRDNLFKIFLNEMTKKEKENLLSKTFDELWRDLWINHSSKTFINEYDNAKRKFEKLNLKQLVKLDEPSFDFTEFSFAKGRKNMKEQNIACAEREFFEETGYCKKNYKFIKNYPIICEEFTGTNGIKYKHIYYLVKMKDNILPPKIDKNNIVQTGEVRNVGWFTYDECMLLIRPYDEAKKNVITKVNHDILNMNNNYICSDFYYTSGKKNLNKS